MGNSKEKDTAGIVVYGEDEDDEDMVLDPDSEPPPKGCKGHRERMKRFLTYSRRFQILVVALVVLDCLVVIIELLIDLGIIIKNVCSSSGDCPSALRNLTTCVVSPEYKERTVCGYSGGEMTCVEEGQESVGPGEVMHILGITVLSCFLLEIILKLYAMDISFLKHKLEVFDAVVVIVSFALDVAYSGNEDAWDGVGLLILLRLWRVTRIINGIIISVKKKSEKQAHELNVQINILKEKLAEMEKEIDQLKGTEKMVEDEKQPLSNGKEPLREDSIVLEPGTESTVL
eukprot:m.7203 g.7203  ORF g.7203 m.7203 type:complete len:287 (+) comp17997_c0_seq1:34-894(+)